MGGMATKYATLRFTLAELRAIRYLTLRSVGEKFPDDVLVSTVSRMDEKVLAGIKELDTLFVNFGDVAVDRCGEQCQYVSRYVDGRISGYPALGEGLRFEGDPKDYHDLKIHRDDVSEFVRRYKDYQKSRGIA